MTRTEAAPTIFVTNVPGRLPLEAVEELMRQEPGFRSFRSVRRMCFCDFEDVRSATDAMRKYQGHKFTRAFFTSPPTPTTCGG